MHARACAVSSAEAAARINSDQEENLVTRATVYLKERDGQFPIIRGIYNGEVMYGEGIEVRSELYPSRRYIINWDAIFFMVLEDVPPVEVLNA